MKIHDLPSYTISLQQLEPPHKLLNDGDFTARCWNPIPQHVFTRINGLSWKDESPISITDLSYIQLTHWNLNGKVTWGELIFHRKLADEIIEIFKELFEKKFPIEKMLLIDNYQADDLLSMSDNNSSALCVRELTNKPGTYSKHSYGCAIDINPLFNPYLNKEVLLPPRSEKYLDRSLNLPGMIDESSICYQAFIKRGYIWGGNWDKPYHDFHHFEKEPSVLEDVSAI